MLDRLSQNYDWLVRNVTQGQRWNGEPRPTTPYIADAANTLDPRLVDQAFGSDGRIISAPVVAGRRVYLFESAGTYEDFIRLFAEPHGARKLPSIRAAKRLP